jgi:hypothetical protein
MTITWRKEEGVEIEINCPFCGHETVPPEYPHCDHTIFLYAHSIFSGFDHVREDFARLYLPLLKQSKWVEEDEIEITEEAEQEFLSGQFPPLGSQAIHLYDDLLDERCLPPGTIIIDLAETKGVAPGRGVAAFSP